MAVSDITAPVFRMTAEVREVPDMTSAEEQIFAGLSEVSVDIKSHLILIGELKARRGNDGIRAVQPPLDIPASNDPVVGD